MANRNRIEMSKSLFSILIKHALQDGEHIYNAEKPRFIKRLSQEDADLMAYADTTLLVVTRQIRLVRISWKNESYFCVFGLQEPDKVPLGLELIDITPGAFAIAILEAKIKPIATGAEIRDSIEVGFHGNDENYGGHDLEEITPLFPVVFFYRISVPHEYHDDEYRIIGYLLSKTYSDGPLALEQDTLTLLANIFEAGSKFIPYRNLVQGILAISWENLYLETYRCIEQLYAQPKVSLLRKNWHSDLPLRELAALLEEHLSWRPKEDEALSLLIKNCKQDIVDSACCAFEVDVQNIQEEKNICRKLALKIYALRNMIVHYRPAHDVIKKSDSDWNIILSAMLDIVEHLYDEQGQEFFVPQNTPLAII